MSRIWLAEAAVSLTSSLWTEMSDSRTLRYETAARMTMIATASPPYKSVSRQRSVRKCLYPPNRYPEPWMVWIRSGSSGPFSLRRR